ncbi:MAG: cysteine hydrolase [Nitrososphaeraceae archaeon]|nr:cysteine hydrolase [Nitrososphaeraceae archaeon]
MSLVIDSARSKISVFYTTLEFLPVKYVSSVGLYAYIKSFNQRPPPTGQELALSVIPNNDEIVIKHRTASIFIGTDFEAMVHNASFTTLVLTGLATELGIESSARDAYNRDFYPVIVSDAVSSSDQESHTRSLEGMKKLLLPLTVLQTQELISFWHGNNKQS